MAMSLFLFIQEPYDIEYIKQDASTANLYMRNIQDIEINHNKITRITTAKESMKYKDKDMLKSVHVRSSEKGFIYDVKSDIAEHQNEIITLKENVVIKRSDDTTFKSNQISYDKPNNRFFCKLDFNITNPTYIASGSGFTYDLDKKSIIAHNIQVDYEMEK